MTDNLKDLKNRVLKDTVAKHEHGTVYGNLNGVNANHEFKKYPVNENFSLEEYVEHLENTVARLLENDKHLKNAVLQNKERIDTLERIVNKYGLE